MRLPLEDVTVIDLSHALAGPFCSTMLADFSSAGRSCRTPRAIAATSTAKHRATPIPLLQEVFPTKTYEE